MAVFATLAAAIVRWLLDPWLGDQAPYATFVVAIIITSWIGGLKPALAATGLGFVTAVYFFVPPRFAWLGATGPHLVSSVMFLIVSLSVAGFGEALRISQRRLERQDAWFEPLPVSLEGPWKQSLRDVLGFGVLLAVLVAGGVAGDLNTRRLIENQRRVSHTHEVINGLEAVLSRLTDAETGQRGYLLAGEEPYLRPYENSVGQVQAGMNRLLELTADNPAQQARLGRLRVMIAEKLGELRRTIARARAGDRQGAIAVVRGDSGRILMDEIRSEVASMQQAERARLQRRAAETQASGKTATLSILLTAALGIVLLVFGFYLSRRTFQQRRRAAEIISEQRERLRVTLASIGDAVITTDARGYVNYLNPVAQELTGWTQSEAEGKALETVFHIVNESTRQVVENPVQKVLQLGRIVGLANHTILIAKDGAERPIDDSAAPIRDGEGRMVGVVLVFRDVTEQRAAERALRDADQRKDEFLATLSHELRNPLAPVKNSLEVMKRAGGDAALIEQSRSTMERQMGQMVRLIDDLLDVSRITRNLLELRRENVELAPLIHHAVEACGPMIERAGQQLTVTLPPQPIYLSADSVRLAQVFGNLLTNASKYTEPGGRIALTAERQGEEVEVVVEDSGVGIPSDMLPRVFEMFTQIDRTLERTQGGLGIGLTLVKRLVEMHQGTVAAHSRGLGEGSEFVVRLPILPEKPEAPLLSGPAVESLPRSRRILVVDDNRDSANSLAKLLELTGYETCTAHDGMEAVEQAEAYRPALILLDIGLPLRNGYDACRAIRREPWGREIRIVALTGWGQDEDRRKSREAGFDDHLVKPVDYAALTQLLDSLASEAAS